MWVRGLKLRSEPVERCSQKSHPMWVRGLKLTLLMSTLVLVVAPYVGAWIETFCILETFAVLRRTLCGCVD